MSKAVTQPGTQRDSGAIGRWEGHGDLHKQLLGIDKDTHPTQTSKVLSCFRSKQMMTSLVLFVVPWLRLKPGELGTVSHINFLEAQ